MNTIAPSPFRNLFQCRRRGVGAHRGRFYRRLADDDFHPERPSAERIGRLRRFPFRGGLGTAGTDGKLNALTGQLAVLAAQSPKWSAFLNELRSITSPAISLTNIVVSSPAEPFSVSGVAANREELNAFKRALENSGFFSDV